MTQLTPTQQLVFDRVLQAKLLYSVLEINGDSGTGKTILLQQLHHHLGGELLQMYDLLTETRQQHPLALEECFEQIVMRALYQHNAVIIDDLQVVLQVAYGRSPRSGLITLALRKLCTYAHNAQKTLIVAMGSDCCPLKDLYPPTYAIALESLTAIDYSFLCSAILEDAIAARLDYDKIYRFASNLNGYQFHRACLELKDDFNLDTGKFIDYLRSRQLSSNVDLAEVQPADFNSLKGVDDVIQSLEANLIIPLEQDELAKELNLKPKRGVLLAGPPGTGKTTIGRALAHRLKSKFFLIDGTFIAGTGDFYSNVHYVFEAAKQNAPAIVFIDDTDVIFEDGNSGLYRYLLTLLDGLESETVGRICVMMTAMTVSSLPAALVRSGRIELWLEMKLPNLDARIDILHAAFQSLTLALSDADIPTIAAATEGFTGADLKRLMEEAKTLYAYDLVQANTLKWMTPKPAIDYFLAAVKVVLHNKQRYAEAEEQAKQQRSVHGSNHHRLNPFADLLTQF
jgi:predicted AAA+ superfamily ATPase